AMAGFVFAQPNDAPLAPAGAGNGTTDALPTDRRPQRRWIGLIAAALIFALVAGGIATIVIGGKQSKSVQLNFTGNTTQQVPTVTSAPAVTPIGKSTGTSATPQPTPQITSCAQISAFAGAGAASVGKHFTDVAFLANSRSFVSTTAEVKGYQYQVIKVCTPNASVNNVRAYYASKLVSAGWTQSSTFPLNGDPTSACGDAYCWKQGTAPTRYIGVEVQSGEGNFGSVAAYQIRVFVAPLASGTTTFMPNGTLVLDPTDTGEYVWDGGTNHINLAGTTTQNSFGTSDIDSITLTDLEGASFGGGFIDPTRTDLGNYVSGVKTQGGHFAKWHILSNNGSQMTLIYVTYAYSIT
ncbi:MAG TPA: hypothetical protein VKB76_09290, partial [Ktedonobacterales bacterium]|nr:hypothetical protein [Ktedonobacterales bacterium]